MPTCAKCRKSVSEPPGGAARVLFGPAIDLSASLEYPCKSCGAVFCIDCMAALKKTGGICPVCGRPIGW
ncbi:MAG: hypothetical protein ACOY3Y_12600 [Acidobacteriota bacterium]